MFYLKFDVYSKDEKVGRVELSGSKVIKNECYLDPSTPYLPMYYPFAYMSSSYDIIDYLSTRVIPHNRDGIERILKANGMNEYNMYKLLEFNHGIKYDDFTWFKFDHLESDRNITYDDVKVRDD